MSPVGGRSVPTAPDARDVMDRALSEDRVIKPSGQLRREVMRRVRAEASVPALRFPWVRFATGVVLAVVAIVATLVGGEDLATSTLEPNLLLASLMLVLFAARFSVGSRDSSRRPRPDLSSSPQR